MSEGASAPAEPETTAVLNAEPSQGSESHVAPVLTETPADTVEKPVPSLPELQSTLTKKFTDAEWKALSEFRHQLPDVFAEGYPDNPNARELPITLWGVAIDPAHPEKDARVSVILMKFLRARNMIVSEAREMLISTLRWRVSINIEEVMKEEFPEDIFGSLGHIYGHDKEGRPVVYNVYGGNQDLKAVFGDVRRFIRWRVALMERSVALLDFLEIDQMVQIHDYEGVSFTSRDANSKAAASEATNIFQNHYPSFWYALPSSICYKKFFVNIPTLLNWMFWIFKPILSANTLAKMSVVGSGHHAIKKALLPCIDATQLPKRYGGEADAF
ncbi:CRAL TRIO domain-containing protein [Gymnopilus junonius]|uniref:Phosphatidylinositol transfer protein SFH5 n=1 Tax=Gymnopilus junonius TaxID=109634 RepID=A0A9P5TR73_GYMJU|nr:CRAL TRIO domain-containing protein [Gymnopilus junonius]